MRGRYAPSPTGVLHLGNLRTALLAWLFARSAGSGFLLRFEDLDDGAVRAEYYDAQRRDLARLGLDWDDELRQTEHLDRYRAALDQLREQELLYECYCSRREIREAASAPHGDLPEGAYPGTCRELSATERQDRQRSGRAAALRLRSAGRRVTFEDRLMGPVTAQLDDTVVMRRDGTPAYSLVVVVDDAYQAIEEVVRGDDLATSTPRQLVLGEHLGLVPPAFAHVPLVLGPDGRRLAKRDGAVTLDDRNALGQTDAQVVGMLAASLGLADADAEPTPRELVDAFEPAALPRDPWHMDADQLG